MGERPVDLTAIALAGVADVHGNSTENLVVKASRDEWVDDPATPGPELMHHEDIVVSSEVQPNERYGLLWKADGAIGGGPAHPPIAMHRAIQSFPDTHHRRVTYTPRGTTRYSEFFDAEALPAPDAPELAGRPHQLTVVSSARPEAPEPEQPFALRRTRRSGVRIWLRRPWSSSGDGELLAVVLGSSPKVPPSVSSRWAKDPVQDTGTPGVATRLVYADHPPP